MEGLLDAQSEPIAPERDSDFLLENAVGRGVRRKQVQASFQRHTGNGERANHADQLGQLAMHLVLAAPATSRQHSGRRDVAGPRQQGDQCQANGCDHGEQAGDHGTRQSAHQSHHSELDAVKLFWIEPRLDQIQRIHTRRPHVESSSPKQCNWAEPASIPALVIVLMQAPLEW